MLSSVLDALGELRSSFALYEQELHETIAKRLTDAGLSYRHEAPIGIGCRIDYLVGDVGIEVKKGKPDAKMLVCQLRRYAACEAIGALVVITPRAVKLPDAVLGKPVHVIVLNRLWGVALP